MKTISKFLITLLALAFLAHAHDDITCNNHQHQLKHPPQLLDIEEDFEPGRVLTSTTTTTTTTYPQIRIYANYDNLLTTAGATYTKYIKDLLAPAVITYFEGALKVKYPVSGNLKLASTGYQYFLAPNGSTLTGHVTSMKIGGNTHTVVNVSPLTEKLQAFHGCSSIPGGIMEDNGGSGTDDSHFEKKFYLYELMSSGSQYGKRVSELSLALLEGSGWYVPNYTYAEPYFFGQGEGCNFINGVCSTTVASFPEFCIGSSRGCGFMGNAGGSCYNDTEIDGCKYVYPNINYHCENPDATEYARLPSVEVYERGAGSKCFTGTLNTKSTTSTTSFCFKFNCTGTGPNTEIQVILGNKTATCTKEGTAEVRGYYGTINCPDPLTFCSTVATPYCPRNCMGRGRCVNNKCVCPTGFTGVDCALTS